MKVQEADRRKVYDVLTANGPDVDMWSAEFGRLAGRAKRYGVIDYPDRLYDWLEKQGYFGPKSDKLRASGDRYY